MDYTSETFEPLMEYELNGLEYRYIYGNDRLSVNITGVDNGAGNLIENGNQIRLYYHMDYLGTADYLTSPMTGKVESWTHYNEWGEITHNAVLKSGQRELDLVKSYATHDYDSVLSMYYAKARFYDAEDRRFVAIDPILDGSKYNITDYVKDPAQLVQYLYVRNNPVIYIDPDGLRYVEDDLDIHGIYKAKEKDVINSPVSFFNLYGFSAEETRQLARWIIANPVAINVTQEGSFEEVFELAGFKRDSSGVYHAKQDALQQYGGYNFIYDIIFDYATSMKVESFEFSYDDKDYRFWAWKGDYLNLGAGAELGIYKRAELNFSIFGYDVNIKTDHWLVDTSLALPMTMRLEDKKGNLIATYSPSDPQWWITSFNPYYQKIEACNLTASFTVDFSGNTGMLDAFYKQWGGKKDSPWTFNQEKFIAILNF